jgi:hypothetical protein
MLNFLLYKVYSELPRLIADGWNTLDVNYEPPRVERLWRQFDDDHRVYLHRIYPCDKALFHPHPWPSAVLICDGVYEMGIGYGKGMEDPPVASKTLLSSGSAYEMVNPDAWHYVKPLGKPSFSLMVTGKPFGLYNPRAHVGKDVEHQPLDANQRSFILANFRRLLEIV